MVRARWSSLAVDVLAAKGCAGGAPPREALITGLGRGLFEFEQDTGEGVVVGFEQAEPFDQLADFTAALVEQFSLLAFEAGLFFLKRSEAGFV
jgi:hypothetical protein